MNDQHPLVLVQGPDSVVISQLTSSLDLFPWPSLGRFYYIHTSNLE